ncbi:hypothetical protein CA54_42250 [Symmachiella macrocystis]|uniref:Uncharacterized protein n=1 Tax=Symmachiella macrocystis TaxID=2527985 RepID=A0A5C6B9N5_9PLAN|nr:hypothetical protein CA54_42250 [Symmachiella macrocystis]
MPTGRMGAIFVLITDIFTDEVIQVLLTKQQIIVQTFLVDALDHLLAARIQVGVLHQ